MILKIVYVVIYLLSAIILGKIFLEEKGGGEITTGARRAKIILFISKALVIIYMLPVLLIVLVVCVAFPQALRLLEKMDGGNKK